MAEFPWLSLKPPNFCEFSQKTYVFFGSSLTSTTQVRRSSRYFGVPTISGVVSFDRPDQDQLPSFISLLKVAVICRVTAASTAASPAWGTVLTTEGGRDCSEISCTAAFLFSGPLFGAALTPAGGGRGAEASSACAKTPANSNAHANAMMAGFIRAKCKFCKWLILSPFKPQNNKSNFKFPDLRKKYTVTFLHFMEGGRLDRRKSDWGEGTPTPSSPPCKRGDKCIEIQIKWFPGSAANSAPPPALPCEDNG